MILTDFRPAVSPAPPTRRAIRLVQLQRIREEEDTRCVPGEQDCGGPEAGAGVGAEGLERAADDEGAHIRRVSLTLCHARVRHSSERRDADFGDSGNRWSASSTSWTGWWLRAASRYVVLWIRKEQCSARAQITDNLPGQIEGREGRRGAPEGARVRCSAAQESSRIILTRKFRSFD